MAGGALQQGAKDRKAGQVTAGQIFMAFVAWLILTGALMGIMPFWGALVTEAVPFTILAVLSVIVQHAPKRESADEYNVRMLLEFRAQQAARKGNVR